MVKRRKHVIFWCDYFKKDLFRYQDCLNCPMPHEVFSEYISCRHIVWKHKREVNTILPKDPSKFPPFDLDNKTVLIYRGGGGLGDLLMITVAVKLLKEEFPSSTIIFQVAPQYIPVLENNPYIDKIIDLKTEIKTDFKIDFSNPCPAASYEAEHNPKIKKHRIDLFCEWVRIKPEGDNPVFVLTEDELAEGKEFLEWEDFSVNAWRVGIALRAGEAWRSWPMNFNLELIDLLLKNDITPVVFDNDSRMAVNKEGVANVCGKPIRFAASVLKFCDLLVTPDGGLAHLAGALDVPILGLFGPTDPMYRISTYENAYWIVKHEKICPYGYKDNSFDWYYPKCVGTKDYPICLRAIKPEEVMEKIKEILKKLE